MRNNPVAPPPQPVRRRGAPRVGVVTRQPALAQAALFEHLPLRDELSSIRLPGVVAFDRLEEILHEIDRRPERQLVPDDPREQNEDLGDNQMRSNEFGIRNLKFVVAGLPEWTRTENEGYDNLKDVYLEVVSQLIRYNGHVAKWVGGIYETPKTVEQAGPVYVYVEKAKQQEAMAFLDRNLFTTPEWLFDDDIFAKTGLDALFVLTRVQSSALRSLLSMRVLGNLVNAEAALGKETYTLDDLFSALNKSVWSELSSGKSPDVYRRSLQNLYVERLLSLLPSGTASAGSGMEAVARVQYELRTLQGRLERASAAEPAVKAHYQYLAKRIKEKLDPK